MTMGHRLNELIASGPMRPDRLVAIGSDLAQYVASAHARGDVVGMLGSTNVFVRDSGDALILDAAWAPISGRRQDDLLAVGVMLYSMATGTAPFQHGQRGLRVPTPPAEINPRLPSGLVQVIQRAVHPDSARRFGSATELIGELAEVLRAPGSLDSLLPAEHVSSTAAVKPPPRPPDEERLGSDDDSPGLPFGD